jgi:hypothetical protein
MEEWRLWVEAGLACAECQAMAEPGKETMLTELSMMSARSSGTTCQVLEQNSPWGPGAGCSAGGGKVHPCKSAWWTRPHPVQSDGISHLWCGRRAHPHPHCQRKGRGRHQTEQSSHSTCSLFSPATKGTVQGQSKADYTSWVTMLPLLPSRVLTGLLLWLIPTKKYGMIFRVWQSKLQII